MYMAQAPGEVVVAAPATIAPARSPNVWAILIALGLLALVIYFLRRLEADR